MLTRYSSKGTALFVILAPLIFEIVEDCLADTKADTKEEKATQDSEVDDKSIAKRGVLNDTL